MTYVRVFQYLLIGLFLQLFSSTVSYAADAAASDSDKKGFGIFLSTGIYDGGEAFGLGLSLGLTYDGPLTRYTLRSTSFVDIFGSVDSCENKSGVVVCEGHSDSSITETALLYGRKWKWFWFSGGIGSIKGDYVAGLFNSHKKSFSATGFAYSVLWGKPFGHRFFNYELSGNMNPENTYFYIAGRLSF